MGNAIGVGTLLYAHHDLIGHGNVIDGNIAGVVLAGGGNLLAAEDHGTIAGNEIANNAHAGVIVAIQSISCTIGGTRAAEANQIINNGFLPGEKFDNAAGVWILDARGVPTGIDVQGNSITGNTGLGIDLSTGLNVNPFTWGQYNGRGPDGVTLNDSVGHTGPNNFQNFPELTSASSSNTSTLISGTFNEGAEPNTTITLDFYANPGPDPSGYGQGQTYLGSRTVQTDGSGNASFTADLAVGNLAGEWITGTATDPDGNTSEFSLDIQATSAPSQTFTQNLPAALPQSTTGTNTLTVQADTTTINDIVVTALDPSNLGASVVSVSVFLNLAPGNYSPTTVQVPTGMTLYINGVPGTVIDPATPAFTLTSGNVVVSNVTFITTGDAPTILVTGGHLTLRGDVVEESTGSNQAAIAITGGTLDLGTASDPGGNTLVVNGPGVFLDNTGPNPVSAVGDTYVINKADQTISPTWPTRAAGANNVTLNLTSSSGLPVSYTVSGPATLDSNNVLTITGLGTVTVTAHQAGNDNYNPAPDIFTTYAVAPASLSGVLFKDFNEDGFQDYGELGSAGVVIELTGTDFNGTAVSVPPVMTGASGYYQFANLLPGTYTVSIPGGVTVTKVTVGLNGTDPTVVGNGHSASGLAIAEGTTLNFVNFGLEPAAGDALHKGETAGIGFWNNKNGQALIKSLNTETGTQLGGWLAATFTHMFGTAGHDLTNSSNATVAASFQTLFATRGDKLEAQVLATALSVYVTNSTLAGGSYAASYGFTVVAGGGTGLATFNVGSDGTAVGQAIGTNMTIMDILLAVDKHATRTATAVGFVLYGGDQATRGLADDLFGKINDLGGI